MEKFLNKETLVITAVVIWAIIQSNYFATKLDLANLKIDILELQSTQKVQILSEIDKKFDEIKKKLDSIEKTK